MAKQAHSNPVLVKNLTLRTEYAQRVHHRGFFRTARSLHAIDVILRVIGADDDIDAVEDVIEEMIRRWVEELTSERDRLAEMRKANGLVSDPGYTEPLHITVQIQSPRVAQLVEMLSLFDSLVVDIDTLWMHQLVDNKQRRTKIYEWQQRTLRLCNRIQDIERRAHTAAKKRDPEAAERAVSEVEEADSAAVVSTAGALSE